MNEPTHILKSGTKIVTHSELGSTTGMLIAQRHLDARHPNKVGEIWGVVPGHGGDVYWVSHKDDSPDGPDKIAAYCWSEFELVES